MAKLRDQPPARRLTWCETRGDSTWVCARLLQRESLQQLFRSPQEGLSYASLAVEIAEGGFLDPASPAILNDLKASSWAFHANALRAVCQFAESEADFRLAWRHLREGTGDPLELARVADFEGLLRLMQRRFEESERLLDRAIQIRLKVGDRHLAGVSTLGKAVVMAQSGRLDRALEMNQRALEMLDRNRDLRMYNVAKHNLFSNLLELGHLSKPHKRFLPAHDGRLGDRVTRPRALG